MDLAPEIDALSNLNTGTDWRAECDAITGVLSTARMKLNEFILHLALQKKPRSKSHSAHEDLIHQLTESAERTHNMVVNWIQTVGNHIHTYNRVLFERHDIRHFDLIENAEAIVQAELACLEKYIYLDLVSVCSMAVCQMREVMHEWEINRADLDRYHTDDDLHA